MYSSVLVFQLKMLKTVENEPKYLKLHINCTCFLENIVSFQPIWAFFKCFFDTKFDYLLVVKSCFST
jgi:hypothetical protein